MEYIWKRPLAIAIFGLYPLDTGAGGLRQTQVGNILTPMYAIKDGFSGRRNGSGPGNWRNLGESNW